MMGRDHISVGTDHEDYKSSSPNAFFDAEVLYGVSKRCEGNMSFSHDPSSVVLAHRQVFLETQGLSLDECVALYLEHKETILVVGESEKGRGMREKETAMIGEALITNTPSTFLFLMTGDCFPVAYHDPIKKVVALAHLGWKSADRKLAGKVVERMQEVFGSDPKDLKVAIGPGIHAQSYVFTDPIQKNAPYMSRYLATLETGETSIDLLLCIEDQILEVGVERINLLTSLYDTATSQEYFSHYRAVRAKEQEGRFVTVLGLR